MYVIIHEPTAKWFPQHRGRGQTHLEFVNRQTPPRIFYTFNAAKGFLTVWCKGPIVRSYSTDWETSIKEEIGLIHQKPSTPRIKSEYRIVPITITLSA